MQWLEASFLWEQRKTKKKQEVEREYTQEFEFGWCTCSPQGALYITINRLQIWERVVPSNLPSAATLGIGHRSCSWQDILLFWLLTGFAMSTATSPERMYSKAFSCRSWETDFRNSMSYIQNQEWSLVTIVASWGGDNHSAIYQHIGAYSEWQGQGKSHLWKWIPGRWSSKVTALPQQTYVVGGGGFFHLSVLSLQYNTMSICSCDQLYYTVYFTLICWTKTAQAKYVMATYMVK